MGYRTRIAGAAMATALVLTFPASALADDAARDAPITDEAVTDRPADPVTDKVSDRPTDKVADRPTDKLTDRVTDHCRKHTHGDHRPHCIDDRHPHDFNVRKLILRLVHAGEWEKLVRLLHWLGWI